MPGLLLPFPESSYPFPALLLLSVYLFIMGPGNFKLQAEVFNLFLGRCDPQIGVFLPGPHQFLHELQNLVLGAHRGRNLAPTLWVEILGNTVRTSAPDGGENLMGNPPLEDLRLWFSAAQNQSI